MVEDKVPQRTVYDFLSGNSDTTSEVVWILMEALGLTITTKSNNFCEREKHMQVEQAEVVRFTDDDNGYINWLQEHQSGFVVNCCRKPSPKYLVLHRAICRFINTDKRKNWTKTGYIKICSESKNTLEDWCRKNVGGTPATCSRCKP
jgi:hypothetical protein